jgi:hypothetical protein
VIRLMRFHCLKRTETFGKKHMRQESLWPPQKDDSCCRYEAAGVSCNAELACIAFNCLGHGKMTHAKNIGLLTMSVIQQPNIFDIIEVVIDLR